MKEFKDIEYKSDYKNLFETQQNLIALVDEMKNLSDERKKRGNSIRIISRWINIIKGSVEKIGKIEEKFREQKELREKGYVFTKIDREEDNDE